MKKLWFDAKFPRKRPQLHALIIGVGHYPKLGPKAVNKELPPLGKKLRSPPVSAKRLAGWLVEHRDWLNGVKLGSIDLIVSEPTKGRHAPMTATFAAIKAAHEEWFKRCDANRDNVALFYFCGHGLQKGMMLLLPEDFGSPVSPWAEAIDFDTTCVNMASCAAKWQYFIADACRQWTSHILQELTVDGVALGRLKPGGELSRTAAKLYATAKGLPAFGNDSGKPSRLTDALIACLEGKAAEKENGRWRVTMSNLGMHVQTMIKFANRSLPEHHRQYVDPTIYEMSEGNTDLLVLPEDEHPRVMVEFGCDPVAATEHARFYYRGISPQLPRCQADSLGAWSTELLAGTYDCGATIDKHPRFASSILPSEPINPPGRSVNIRVAGRARRKP